MRRSMVAGGTSDVKGMSSQVLEHVSGTSFLWL